MRWPVSKLIREARMGRPKQFKSGAILGTYPKPMLYFGLDRSGVDVLPSKNLMLPADYVQVDTFYEEIQHVKPIEFANWAQKTDQPKVLSVDFTGECPTSIDLTMKPAASTLGLTRFTEVYNQIAGRPSLPWKTVVLDGATGLTDLILSYISASNPAAMADARQWAGQAGAYVRKTILAMTSLPCHFVCLLHSFVDKNEQTGEISEQPNVYSQILRDDFFGLFSQVFYSFKDSNGKPFIRVSDSYPVKGIGPRWPLGLPKECAPDFKSIYGKELV